MMKPKFGILFPMHYIYRTYLQRALSLSEKKLCFSPTDPQLVLQLLLNMTRKWLARELF